MKTLRWGLCALVVGSSPLLLAAETDVDAQLKSLRADVEALKAAKPAATASSLKVWVQMTGYYNNTVGAGDDSAGVSLNRSTASSEVDLGLEGQLAEGLETLANFRVDNKNINIFDLWAQQRLPFGLSLRVGYLDLTYLFDSSAIADNEKEQFIRSEFVDSPLLGQGPNGPALRLLWQATESLYVQAAVQDYVSNAVNPFDDVFSIVESGYKHGLLGGGEVKAWYREIGRGQKGAVPAVGVVVDQTVMGQLQAFVRWAQDFTATGLEHDASDAYVAQPLNMGGVSGSSTSSTLSGGLDWAAPLSFRPDDHLAAAWGTVQAADSSKWDFVEAYYSWSLSPNAQISLDYQGDFSRLKLAVANDWNGDGVTDYTSYAALDNEHKLVGRLNLAY